MDIDKISSLLLNDRISLDVHGRVVIEGEDLLGLVAGANYEPVLSDSNTACHDNGGCLNAGCRH